MSLIHFPTVDQRNIRLDPATGEFEVRLVQAVHVGELALMLDLPGVGKASPLPM